MNFIIFMIFVILCFLGSTILTIVSIFGIIGGIFQVRKNKKSKDDALSRIRLNAILLLIAIGLLTIFFSIFSEVFSGSWM